MRPTNSPAEAPAREHAPPSALRWLLLGAALLGLVYNFAILLGFGPDEPRHMAYVRLLVDERRLPFLLPNGTEYAGAHSLHPPLYYALLALPYALFRGLPGESEWHLLRLVSLALCLASLPMAFAIVRKVGASSRAGRDAVAILAVAQIALLPIFGMTAGTINNDSAMLFAVTLFVWLLAVRYPHDQGFGSALILGVCLGLGGLSKATALLCDGAALAAYFLAQQGVRRAVVSPRTWARAAVVLGVGLAICGPWYAHNLNLYGSLTPIAAGYSPSDLKWLPPRESGLLTIAMHPNFPSLFGGANWGIFLSLWSQKDWIPEAARSLVYSALALYCATALVGLVLARRRKREDEAEGEGEPVERGVAVWSSAAALAINWAACAGMALLVHWGWAEGGRYLLPSLLGLSLLLARGWDGLAGSRLPRVTLAWCLAMVVLNAVAIVNLVAVLNPKYGPGAK